MKFIIAFVLLFSLSFSTATLAQEATMDSLENELLIYIKKDTVRVNLLNALADSYHKKDLDKTIAYVKESESIAKAIAFKKGHAKSLHIKGKTKAFHSNYEQGFQYYDEALQLYKTINFRKGVSECYKDMGLFCYKNGNQKQAIKYYKQSLEVSEALNDKEEIFVILNNIGWSYIQIGEYSEALLFYKKALSISEEINNKTMLSYCLSDMGAIYTYQGNYPLALDYFNKSLVVGKKNADSVSIANTLGNMGPVYNHLEKYDEAIDCYKKSIKYLKNTNKEAIASNLNNLGLAYKDLKKYTRAYEFLKDAQKIYKEINNKANEALTLNNIGDVYLELKDGKAAFQYFEKAKNNNLEVDNQRGLCNSYLGIAKVYVLQKTYDKALINALKSKEISSSINLINYQRDAHQLLSEIYKHTGKYKKAFESHQQFKALNDSLFNKKSIEKIAQLEYEYKYKQELDSANFRASKLTKTVKKTAQNLEKAQHNLLLGVIAFLLVTLILGTIIFFLKLRNAKAKTQNIAIEQKLLRSQMTPHFIFNSLSVLQGMILNKEDKKAISYLSKFSKLLRITLENSRDKMVPLHQELMAINNYLELQNLEMNPPCQYTIWVDDTIDQSLFKIPPMLIQPFIENAIEHGFENQKEDRKIEIQIKYSDKKLTCTITDNGMGIDAQKENKKAQKKSLATTITSERIKFLSKDFKIKGS
ncbi:MAG TPA: tetratricopeptide repeat protein, partial [Bacteroidetes bacterium]|nr:tetratricopeptide repeat protein [Bacteroidota bacterium]